MSARDELVLHLTRAVVVLLDPREVDGLAEAVRASPWFGAPPTATLEVLTGLREALLACTSEEVEVVRVAARLCSATPANLDEALAMAAVVLRPPQ